MLYYFACEYIKSIKFTKDYEDPKFRLIFYMVNYDGIITSVML